MVFIIILFNPLQQLLKTLGTMSKQLFDDHRNLPYSFIRIGANRIMDILMLVYIQILIRSILTAVFLRYKEFADYDLFCILARSHAGVYKLYDLSDVLTFD